ncbi:MAG: bifunctional DNA-formamidopyrimidine glycosylase/DNA-(apurinic or apyrimidinic site) lyase [Rickettsiales bacterium]
MPELPEVETVKRGLETVLPGLTVEKITVNRHDLRHPIPENLVEQIKGRKFIGVKRRAKYLLLEMEGGVTLLSHLGMSGSWVVRKKGEYKPQTHDHIILSLKGDKEAVFNDPRRFGLLLPLKTRDIDKHPLLKHLGPEPLEKAFSPDYLEEALKTRSGPIKTALMNQELVVGVGNIYASEALFRAKVHPSVPAKHVAARAKDIIYAVQAVLKDAIKSGGSTLRNYAQASGDTGYFQHYFLVYGREGKPCTVCETPISKITQVGRSTFFCKHCQKRPKK